MPVTPELRGIDGRLTRALWQASLAEVVSIMSPISDLHLREPVHITASFLVLGCELFTRVLFSLQIVRRSFFTFSCRSKFLATYTRILSLAVFDTSGFCEFHASCDKYLIIPPEGSEET